jgi:uncharacterized membrane protein
MKTSPHHPVSAQIVDTACESIVIHAPVADVYTLASAIENLARFIPSMRDFESFERLGETSVARAVVVNHREVHTIVDVTLCIPEQRIAWFAIGEPDHAGAVSFHPLSDSTTRLTVKILTNSQIDDLPAVARRCMIGFKRFAEAERSCRSTAYGPGASAGVKVAA